MNTAHLLTMAMLVLVGLPLAWHSIHLQRPLHQGDHSKTLVLILIVALIVVLIVLIVGTALAFATVVPGQSSLAIGGLEHQLAVVRANLNEVSIRPSKMSSSSAVSMWRSCG